MSNDHHRTHDYEMKVDLEYLERLLCGKKEQVVMILQLFSDHIPPALREIKALCQQHDWAAVRARVHGLKSYYAYLGNPEVSTKLKEWETRLADSTIQADYDRMFEELEQTTDAILRGIRVILGEGI
jgi:HPt (histidine-containing phosphotransfer) domain-containing protein